MVDKNQEPKAMTPEQMRAMIEQERQERIEACTVAIKTLLQKYNCQMTPQVIIQGSNVTSQIVIVAQD